ncbi:MAG TPA: hypothetical protein PLE45_02000 [Spirochaetota bacterium]|nr:hypothetical protein [Spirochaetota bacterium]HOL57004.1 hypothetical protein [Spirochaetota bacterium]HPP04052.1 hypothetical protein [Spirochaetota bacterium]
MKKLIGFLITKEKKEINIDIFNAGLKLIHFKHSDYFIYLWGIGDIDNCKINEKYSLSFPLSDNLLDRNVIIYIEKDKIIVENDWLGSIPVFYSSKELIVSTIANFCIKNKKIHNEGLSNFCEFGYSVFEQTIFEEVKFMRYFSKLIITENNIEIDYKEDFVLNEEIFKDKKTTDEVIQKMQNYIWNIESQTSGEIIIPTSGGYDSRILNYLVKDKNRIRSFTYGISKNQYQSSEVVYAKKLSEILNIYWEQIDLKEYHKYIDQWFAIYGISTHLHGMYHIEFYTKILKKHKFLNPTLLSGIVGDLWATGNKFKPIRNPKEIIHLGYTHGLNLDLKYLLINSKEELKKKFFSELKEYLQNDRLRSIFVIRTKIILISYLTQIPEYFGIPVWTPFLNFEIVHTILSLSDEQRENRIWQRIFFRNQGINIEEMNLNCAKSNRLDYETARNYIFEPLSIKLLKNYISTKRINEINNILNKKKSFFNTIKNEILFIPKVGGILRRLGFKNEYLTALYEYYTIKAIEKGLKYEY